VSEAKSLELANAEVTDYVAITNPSADNVLVTGLSATDFTIRLFNQAGTKVYERVGASVNVNTIAVALTEFNSTDAPGVYKLTFTPNAAGEWTLQVIHATYCPAGQYHTFRCYSILYGQTGDATVRQRFVVIDDDLAPVTGLAAGVFTTKLFNPSGTEVSDTVAVTISEVGGGVYEVTWTANAVGKWLLIVKNATYFSYGQYDTYRYEIPTTPGAPEITAVSVSGAVITVTIDGDSGVTNYAKAYDDNDDVETTGSRSGDGDIELTVGTRGAFYDVVAYSYHPDGNFGAPSAPWRIYVRAANEAKTASLRAAIGDRLVGSSAIQSLLGTDKNGAVPVYEARNFGAPNTPAFIVYELTEVYDPDESVRTRHEFECELSAEFKGTSSYPPADLLDKVGEELATLFNDWGYEDDTWWMEYAWIDGPSAPTHDWSEQGYEGRTWRWRFVVSEK